MNRNSPFGLSYQRILQTAFILGAAVFISVVVSAAAAYASEGGYTIEKTGTPTITGTNVTITGLAHAHPYVGQPGQQHVSIDWNNNGTWIDANSFTPSFGGSGRNKFFDGPWSGSHTYASAGTKTIKVKVHHSNEHGDEESDAAILKVTIVIPPPPPAAPTCTLVSTPATITAGDTFTLSWTSANATSASMDNGLNISNALNGSFAFPGGAFPGSIFSSTNYTLSVAGLGGSTTCNTTVSVNPAADGSITVVDIVFNDNGGSASASDFTNSVTGGTPVSFAGSLSGTVVSVPAYGSYSVTTASNPAGYSTSYVGMCSGTMTPGAVGVCTITHNDTPSDGENTLAQCTDGIDNDANESTDLADPGCSPFIPTLTVVKLVANAHGGTKSATDFPLFVGETQVSSGAATNFQPGTYSVTETNALGYSASYSENCANGSITLAAGDTKTCTITNSDTAASLTVIKHVINDDGGTNSAADFTLTATGTNPTQTSITGSESGVTISLDAGSYAITEGEYSGYATSYSEGCSGTIAMGGTAYCTVTNNDIAQPVVVVETPSTTPTPAPGGNGPIAGSFGIAFGGQVLGAATGPEGTTGISTSTNATSTDTCAVYLTQYLRMGKPNDIDEVKKLQTFLNKVLGLSLTVDGTFGLATHNAVIALQEKYADEILMPWTKAGYPLSKGTGYVFKTTKHWINNYQCESLNETKPVLP